MNHFANVTMDNFLIMLFGGISAKFIHIIFLIVMFRTESSFFHL